MKPRIVAALEGAASARGWGRRQWERLLAGAAGESARAFEELACGLGGRLGAQSAQWGLRFAALPGPWRAFAAGLGADRLGELLGGNLSHDDSGIDAAYGPEREALRMLCALRVFKESSLGAGDPDPRVNSLRRIALGDWREFPGAGAPGMAPSQEEGEAIKAAGAGEVARLFSARAIASCSERAVGACAAAGAACGLALGAAGGWWMGSPAVGACLFLGAAAAWLNPAALARARRAGAKRMCERLLAALGCPRGAQFETLARRGMLAAARACADPGAGAFADRVEARLCGWDEMGPELRKAVARARADRAKASLLEAAEWVALDERRAIGAHVEAASGSREGRRRL